MNGGLLCLRRFPLKLTTSRCYATLVKDKAFINGAWTDSKDRKTFKVKNPANGQELGEVPDMGANDAELAIEYAYDAFQSWKETTAKVIVIFMALKFCLESF